MGANLCCLRSGAWVMWRGFVPGYCYPAIRVYRLISTDYAGSWLALSQGITGTIRPDTSGKWSVSFGGTRWETIRPAGRFTRPWSVEYLSCSACGRTWADCGCVRDLPSKPSNSRGLPGTLRPPVGIPGIGI